MGRSRPMRPTAGIGNESRTALRTASEAPAPPRLRSGAGWAYARCVKGLVDQVSDKVDVPPHRFGCSDRVAVADGLQDGSVAVVDLVGTLLEPSLVDGDEQLAPSVHHGLFQARAAGRPGNAPMYVHVGPEK